MWSVCDSSSLLLLYPAPAWAPPTGDNSLRKNLLQHELCRGHGSFRDYLPALDPPPSPPGNLRSGTLSTSSRSFVRDLAVFAGHALTYFPLSALPFLLFLKYAFTGAPPAALMGSAGAVAGAAAEPVGTGGNRWAPAGAVPASPHRGSRSAAARASAGTS